ncbi:MAG TPA: M56 family metallopeptidase [Longimicrobiales bacterium]|nr:M56 family metallopeptidase [Longimicrobiales bacterium]
MTAWILYALAVSGAVTAAAALADRLLRGLGHPTRGIWAAAMVLSVGLPLGALVAPSSPPVPPAELIAEMQAAPTASPPVPVPVPWWERVPRRWDFVAPTLLSLWMAASVALGSLILIATVALQLRARRWPRIRLPQGDAFLSERFGPALLGGLRARVVIPRWAFALGTSKVGMIMTHEDEHRRAGDAHLLLGAAVVAALVPWIPFLWYQLRRLRSAVELDCDARVIRRGIPPVSYAEVLLDVGARSGDRLGPWAAWAAEPTLLERRLTMIVRGRENLGRRRAALASVLSTGLLALACGTDAPPLSPEGPEAARQVSAQEQPTGVLKKQKPAAAPADGRPLAGVLLKAEASQPLVLLDGVRVTHAELAGIDKSTIQRVEVVKGQAALAQFGSEAEGGVIHIFLKDSAGEGAGEER